MRAAGAAHRRLATGKHAGGAHRNSCLNASIARVCEGASGKSRVLTGRGTILWVRRAAASPQLLRVTIATVRAFRAQAQSAETLKVRGRASWRPTYDHTIGLQRRARANRLPAARPVTLASARRPWPIMPGVDTRQPNSRPRVPKGAGGRSDRDQPNGRAACQLRAYIPQLKIARGLSEHPLLERDHLAHLGSSMHDQQPDTSAQRPVFPSVAVPTPRALKAAVGPAGAGRVCGPGFGLSGWSGPRTKRAIASARLDEPVFARICLTCHLTVPSVSVSRSAIAALVRPWAISRRISVCRGLRGP
jgi:hypothetical protein